MYFSWLSLWKKKISSIWSWTPQVFVSRNVTFFEQEFSFKNAFVAIEKSATSTHDKFIFYDDLVILQNSIETLTLRMLSIILIILFLLLPSLLLYSVISQDQPNVFPFFRIIMWKQSSRLGLTPHQPLALSPLHVCHTIFLKSFHMTNYLPLIKFLPLL